MKKVLFYFHGFGSSSQTDKVNRLKDMGYQVIAWDINPDPNVSVPKLQELLDYWCIDFFEANLDLVFVGTSLGAWYAKKIAENTTIPCVLINPCIDPARSLKKFGLDEFVLNSYDAPIQFSKTDTVVIAENDEVLDFSKADFGDAKVVYVPTGGHRFNGPEFEEVIGPILKGIK